MQSNQPPPASIDEYITRFSPEIQVILQTIRSTIQQAAPEALEKISYGMPTFTLNGNLIHFAAFKQHIGLYPPVGGDQDLKALIARYQGEKGNLKFPLDEPIPYGLIRAIVEFRTKEQSERAASKGRKSSVRRASDSD